MPIKKKKNRTKLRTVLVWTLIASILLLMFISFPATQHMTEIVVFP
ncbi:MAG: hypothetical protein UIC65_00455 [Alphaproteobacteria bacterium]|nr:hypothetical protein [Alphaproteobacteria bacterium]